MCVLLIRQLLWLVGRLGSRTAGLNHTSWVVVVTQTDLLKLVRNCWVIEVFCSVFVFSHCFACMLTGGLLLRTPGPVPLGTCICFQTFVTGVAYRQGTLTPLYTWGLAYVLLVEANPFSELGRIFPDYALRISLGTFLIFLCGFFCG